VFRKFAGIKVLQKSCLFTASGFEQF
jgi:hypothetical protein